MQIGGRIDEEGVLVEEGGTFYLRRDVGGRWTLEFRSEPTVPVGTRVRLIGTCVSLQLAAVQELQPIR